MRNLPLAAVALAQVLTPLAAPADRITRIPIGVTDLLEDPACTVGFQRDGKEAATLGWRWTGFDPVSGVYFVPEERNGRRQVFMHCPWKRGPGAAFADFALRLPRTKRIQLHVSCCLRETAPGSDGVTYRVRVEGRALWHTHGAWKTWQHFTVDLSSFAGKELTLRLEVDPGPQRNTRDDWSLWGKLEISAGTDAEIATARERREREQRKQRIRELKLGAQRAGLDLATFARAEIDASRPSTADAVRNSLSRDGDAWLLRGEARDETIEYRLRPRAGLLLGLSVTVDGAELDPTPFTGGARVMLGGREYVPGSRQLSSRLVSCEASEDALACRYEYGNGPATAALTARLRAEGKSLAISLEGEASRFSGFEVRTQGGPRVPTAFCLGLAPRCHRQGVYVAAFADLWQSDASSAGGSSARSHYHPLTDGSRRAMRDTFYLTVSSHYPETLPNVPHRPSPFLGDLAGRVVMDVWGGSFAEDERWLRGLAPYGVTQFLIIKHVWQRDGYDRTFPNVMPANARQGGDAALRGLSLAAQQLGHRFCVHENFYDYYPNAEAFRTEHCALDPGGRPQRGWDRGPVVASIMKPSRLMDYARRFTPEVKRRYDCDAAYHDIMPTWRVDYDAEVADSGMIRRTHEYTKQLCAYDHEVFGGPVVFEAICSAMSGVFDGGCNHGTDTYRTPPAAAFELLKVHSKMSNHGFGYYERWLPWGYGPSWGSYVMTDRELDHYRATQIAFGRTGFIGQQLRRHPHGLIREYHLMQAFGRAYTGQELRKLAYVVERDGWQGWVDAGTAYRLNEWHRMRATYEGGQTVYVNLSENPWAVADRVLPPYGSLTTGPRSTAYTAVIDGQIVDFARYDDITYVDARSHQWLPPEPLPPITPSLGHWQDNGDGTFDLTINWKIARKLEGNRIAFWHFKHDQKIVFQADHALSPPTTQWSVGQTIKDGPRRVKARTDVPENDYDVVVGLYDNTGRAALVHGADWMRVAKLHVNRQDGKVTEIKLSPAEPELTPGTSREPYLQGANTAERVIDFGDVATNGAIVLRKTKDGTEVVPVPIGESMRVELSGKYAQVTLLDAAGRPLPSLALHVADGRTWFQVQPTVAQVLLR